MQNDNSSKQRQMLLWILGACSCWTALQFSWTSLISRYIPALSRCHLSHSGPAPRCQQHHLSRRQKSERTHLENLLLRTFSRTAFSSRRAETGNDSWPGKKKQKTAPTSCCISSSWSCCGASSIEG